MKRILAWLLAALVLLAGAAGLIASLKGVRERTGERK